MVIFYLVILVIAVLIGIASIVNGINLSGLSISAFLIASILILYKIRNAEKNNIGTPARRKKSHWFAALPERRRYMLAIAIISYFMAASKLLGPGLREVDGRWAWLNNMAIEYLGAHGISILFFAIGTCMLICFFRYKN